MKIFKNVDEFSIVRIELNYWNGFIFEIFSIEYNSCDRALFAIWAGRTYLHLSICFLRLEIF